MGPYEMVCGPFRCTSRVSCPLQGWGILRCIGHTPATAAATTTETIVLLSVAATTISQLLLLLPAFQTLLLLLLLPPVPVTLALVANRPSNCWRLVQGPMLLTRTRPPAADSAHTSTSTPCPETCVISIDGISHPFCRPYNPSWSPQLMGGALHHNTIHGGCCCCRCSANIHTKGW